MSDQSKKLPDLIVTAADTKSKLRIDALASITEDLGTLVRLVKAWRAGTWKKAPRLTIGAGLLGLLYLINPLDLLPDILPLLGMVDDIAVLRFFFMALRRDMDLFRADEKTLNSPRSAWIEEAEEARKLLDEQRKVTEDALKAAEDALPREEQAREEARQEAENSRREIERLRKLLGSTGLPPGESGQ